MIKAVGILGLLMAVAAMPAAADTYRWTDAEGNLHFTDDSSRAAREGGMKAFVSRAEAPVNATAESSAEEAPTLASLISLHGDGEVRIPFERDGHLIRLRVRLNHRIEVPFYLDTGSSGVVIPSSVAKRLSLEIGATAPKIMLHTTGGEIQVPAVQLDSIQIGGAEIENLEASVSPNIEIGLLGGEFFNNFSYSIDPVSRVMVLRRVSSPH